MNNTAYLTNLNAGLWLIVIITCIVMVGFIGSKKSVNLISVNSGIEGISGNVIQTNQEGISNQEYVAKNSDQITTIANSHNVPPAELAAIIIAERNPTGPQSHDTGTNLGVTAMSVSQAKTYSGAAGMTDQAIANKLQNDDNFAIEATASRMAYIRSLNSYDKYYSDPRISGDPVKTGQLTLAIWRGDINGAREENFNRIVNGKFAEMYTSGQATNHLSEQAAENRVDSFNRAREAIGSDESAACFLPSTQITLSDGYKEIQDVKVGDQVLSYDLDNKQNVKAEVVNVFSHKENKYMIINGNMKVTPNHIVYAK
ncbi:MAG: Hint domain-containing protein [Nanoarchaeota archaeon]